MKLTRAEAAAAGARLAGAMETRGKVEIKWQTSSHTRTLYYRRVDWFAKFASLHFLTKTRETPLSCISPSTLASLGC